MTTFVSFIVVLGILIFVHEFGHFIVARRSGVGVLKFSLGFGPSLFKRKKGETEYRISVVPLGGYVKLLGDDPGEEVDDPARAFLTQPVRKRLAIVSAGPIFNMLFAVILASLLYMVGFPNLSTTIGEVKEGSPAAAAGLKSGDAILALNGRRLDTWTELQQFVHARPGQELLFMIGRGSESFTVPIVPERQETTNIFGEKVSLGLIGVAPAGEFVTVRYNPVVAVGKGFVWTGNLIKLTFVSVVKMIQGKVSADNLAGPLGIAKLAGESARSGAVNFVFFLAFVSVSLGILNLLPIPVLDGGHILFFSIEAVMRRPVSVRKREIAQQVGLVLLIFLMLFAFYNDLMRFFH